MDGITRDLLVFEFLIREDRTSEAVSFVMEMKEDAVRAWKRRLMRRIEEVGRELRRIVREKRHLEEALRQARWRWRSARPRPDAS